MSDNGSEHQGGVTITGRLYRLGPHWVAIVQADGSIVLQNLSNVVVGGSSETLNLMDSSSLRSEVLGLLEEYDPERFAVRTLCLMPDGSVQADPDSISPRGEITEEKYTVISPTIPSAFRYFARKSGKGDW